MGSRSGGIASLFKYDMITIELNSLSVKAKALRTLWSWIEEDLLFTGETKLYSDSSYDFYIEDLKSILNIRLVSKIHVQKLLFETFIKST